MAKHNRSPLFTPLRPDEREALRVEFRNTKLYRLLRDSKRYIKSSRVSQSQAESLSKRWSTMTPRAAVDEILRTPAAAAAATIVRYARGAGSGVIRKLLDYLGPVGQLIRMVGGGLRRANSASLKSLIQLLQGAGYEVLPPQSVIKANPNSKFLKTLAERGARASRAYLETINRTLPPETEGGYRPIPSGDEYGIEPVRPSAIRPNALPGGIDPFTKGGKLRKSVTLPIEPVEFDQFPIEPGPRKKVAEDEQREIERRKPKSRRFDVEHPIVTGEPVKAVGSDNVHSFSYDYDKANLYIRFWHHQRGAAGKDEKIPGALYRYAHVPPSVFLGLMKANSKGGYVWDHIRIRGTVSGHQFDYQLVGVATNGYLPRKATNKADGEWYIRRQVKVAGSQRWLSSSLPNEKVRGAGVAPNRGSPNRGRPNDGRPPDGRP